MISPNAEQERRQADPVLIAIDRLSQNLEAKHGENIDRIGTVEADIKKVLAGFPGGDPDGHRRAHEAQIRKAEERTKFWAELRIRLADKGVWAVVTFACAACYWYLREGPKQ